MSKEDEIEEGLLSDISGMQDENTLEQSGEYSVN